jgi:hypothetical protein
MLILYRCLYLGSENMSHWNVNNIGNIFLMNIGIAMNMFESIINAGKLFLFITAATTYLDFAVGDLKKRIP